MVPMNDVQSNPSPRFRPMWLWLLAAAAAAACLAAGALIAAMTTQQRGEPIPNRVHVLGDSYAGSRHFQQALRDAMPGYDISFDAVGGSTIAEQLERFRGGDGGRGMGGDPADGRGGRELWNAPLVIVDGGLTDRDPIVSVEGIAATLTSECPAWFYVEPPHRAVPNAPIGSPRYEQQEAAVQAIRAKYPKHFIATKEALVTRAPARGPGDEDDRANGWVPRSLRADRIHLNAEGYEVMARLIAERFRAAQARRLAEPCGL
jgi:hypothetical protein